MKKITLLLMAFFFGAHSCIKGMNELINHDERIQKFESIKKDLSQLSTQKLDLDFSDKLMGLVDKALKASNPLLAKKIIKYGFERGLKSTDFINKEKNTPLHYLQYCQDWLRCELAREWLHLGFSPDCKNKEGLTPLHMVTIDKATYELLLDNADDINIQDYNRRTPLHWALDRRDTSCDEIIELLIKNRKIDLSKKDYLGFTVLHHAAQKGRVKAIKTLIDCGAQIDVQDNDSNTAFHWAVINRHKKIVKILVNTPNKIGETMLHIAARNGEENGVKLLLNHGAQIDIKDKYGNTAFHLAAINRHKKIVKILVNTPNKIGETMLHIAASNGEERFVETLIGYGAQIDVQDNDGWTALHLAVIYRHENIVELLLKQDAQIDVQNKFGRTGLHYAVINGRENIANVLWKKMSIGSKLMHVIKNNPVKTTLVLILPMFGVISYWCWRK